MEESNNHNNNTPTTTPHEEAPMSTLTPTLTGYQLAKAVNTLLAEENLSPIPPQMIYNYIKNNLIPTTSTPDGKKVIRMEDAEAWMHKYVTRRMEKALKEG
jgi:hypothetical protein